MAHIVLLLIIVVPANLACASYFADQPTGPQSTETHESAGRPQSNDEKSSNNTKADHDAVGDKLPSDLRKLFEWLDEFGRSKVQDANFAGLEFADAEQPGRTWTEKVWIISQDEESVVVMKDDLIPWIYDKNAPTTIPSSWEPASVRLQSIREADFETLCKELSKPEEEAEDDLEQARRSLRAPGPSYRLLVSHAAWKKGLANYCMPIISSDLKHKANFEEYQSAVREDLAWLHFLRGVNLLMFADRKEVLPHLRLVSKLSPEGRFTAQSQDLVDRLEKLIANENNLAKPEDESKLSDAEKAEFYVSQIKDLRCPQFAQPGFIMPYLAVVDGKPVQNPPSRKLREMGMNAVPALIKALEDDTPTRTVYHWRDFAHNRVVWRVSDFARNILRDITKKDFGYRRVVGFTLSSMDSTEKQHVIEEIKRWYSRNKGLSPDDQLFGFFSSPDSDDWITAGNYFLKTKDNRAVKPLMEKIPLAQAFAKGDLCELVAEFGDPDAKKVIRQVMETAPEHSDRLSAAIALWTLGENSGIPIVIEYVKAKDQPYGRWEEPVWFLMRTKTKDSIETLKSVVTDYSPHRAGEVVGSISASITGDLSSQRREAAGCVEICPVLIAAMGRAEYTGGTINDVKVRIKDAAAKAFVLLREGTNDPFPGRFVQVDPKLFNELDPDEGRRDAQIEALIDWYEQNKDKLSWDSTKGKLLVKE